MASSVARLSLPWQLACTMTARSTPSRRCSAARFLLGVGRRVGAVGRVGEPAGRPEDMAMRVAGPCRQEETRPARVGVWRLAGFHAFLPHDRKFAAWRSRKAFDGVDRIIRLD